MGRGTAPHTACYGTATSRLTNCTAKIELQLLLDVSRPALQRAAGRPRTAVVEPLPTAGPNLSPESPVVKGSHAKRAHRPEKPAIPVREWAVQAWREA